MAWMVMMGTWVFRALSALEALPALPALMALGLFGSTLMPAKMALSVPRALPVPRALL